MTASNPTTPRLEGIRACVFDAYGTLFDFASAAAHCEDVPEERRAALRRDKQLQYAWLRTLQNRYADFWQVTGEALDFALESLDLAQPALRERLMELYLGLKPFAEVPSVLGSLRERGFRTAILSNGSPKMLEALVRRSRLEHLFDAILSADAVCAFKTHPKVYQSALDALSRDSQAGQRIKSGQFATSALFSPTRAAPARARAQALVGEVGRRVAPSFSVLAFIRTKLRGLFNRVDPR